MSAIDSQGYTSVITRFGLSTSFPEMTGVRQGDILSPLKFIAWLDPLLEWLHSSPSDITLANQAIHALAYADDLWLVAASKQDLQTKLDKASLYLQYHGVHCNAEKSHYSSTETGFDPTKL